MVSAQNLGKNGTVEIGGKTVIQDGAWSLGTQTTFPGGVPPMG